MFRIALPRQNVWLCAALLATCLSACTPTDPKRESIVQGTVTYDKKPLKMGVVMFQPESGPFASGDIQPDGTYSLEAVIGPNRVQIICRDPEDTRPITELKGPRKEPKSYIPEKYGMPSTPLKFEVGEGDNVADFALE